MAFVLDGAAASASVDEWRWATVRWPGGMTATVNWPRHIGFPCGCLSTDRQIM
jgi:hypothetical protein